MSVFQGYGTADVGAIAYECEHACGWHVAPGRVVEVLEPGTGEIVVSVDNDVYPRVRFGTGDVSSFERTVCVRENDTTVDGLSRTCGRGCQSARHVRPSPADRSLGALYAEVPRFQAVVTFEERGTDIDAIVVRVEAGGDPSEVAERLKEELKLRVEVELETPGTLARDAPRIRDDRTWD